MYPLVIVAAVVVIRWLHIVESRVFYMPSRAAFQTPLGYEDVSIPTPDGLTLHGWFIPPAGAKPGSGPWPTILHCHGNAGNVDSHIDFSSFLTDHGFAVLIFDYRGYGRSSLASGLSRDLLLIDARAALDYLLTRPDVDRERIAAFGVSLGAVFALRLAADRPEVKAICAVSAFSSWSAVAGDHLPVVGPLLIPSGLNPADSARELGAKPLLIVHGDRDEIVNARHAGIIEEAARSGGAVVARFVIPGGDHNGILQTEEEQRPIVEFFAAALRVNRR